MAKQTRATRQKEMLAETMARMDSVFSAQELHRRAKARDARIGIATVYRFLAAHKDPSFHNFTCDRRTIYAHDKSSHCHFTCTSCGERSHFTIRKADFLKEIDGDVCHFQLEVHGVCKKCKR